MKVRLLIGIMMLGLVACGGSSSSDDKKSSNGTNERGAVEAFERTHLAGEIDGQAWTQISGRVTAPNEEGKSYLTLWDVNIADPCNPSEVGNRAVVAKISLEPARHELTEEKTITLSVYDGEMVKSKEVKSGVLKIVKIEKGMLHGAIMANHDETNHLEGSFAVKICK